MTAVVGAFVAGWMELAPGRTFFCVFEVVRPFQCFDRKNATVNVCDY